MNSHVFIPVTDDMLENHPEMIEGPLVPYHAGLACEHWLSIELNPKEELKPAPKKHKVSSNLPRRSFLDFKQVIQA